jgi:YVTN family beta-propeller protein
LIPRHEAAEYELFTGGNMQLKALFSIFFAGFFFLHSSTLIEFDGSVYLNRSSSVIAITADGATLLVVNPDSNSLTLVDTATETIITEISVGLDPRAVALDDPRGRAYVCNQASDSISIVDLTARRSIKEVAVGNRPVGAAVSPDGRTVAVAELGDDRVRLLDPSDLSTLTLIAVADRPYGLTFAPDGRRLLVTHLLRGQVSVLSLNRDTSSPSPLVSLVTQIPTWENVAPAPGVAVNATGSRAYLPQTIANGKGFNSQFDSTVFARVSVLNLQTDSQQSSEDISLPEKDQPVGLPWNVALARHDTELWVVNAASNDVSVLDISNPLRARRLAHILVSDNPRGVVISPDGTRAYVSNALAGTVSVIDANTYTVIATVRVTDMPLPPVLLNGKRLFHSSARSDLSQARWISCNTCHIEGEQDGRTWMLQFTGNVPLGATPIIKRNTTSLLGMIETYPLRWSAEWNESADSEFSVRFEQFGTGLIHDGEMNPTLGAPNQGRSYDLDCLATYIDSLALPARKHTLTPAELRGKALFESPATKCAECHPAPLYTDLRVHDVGTADSAGEWFGPLIDTPTLRFLFDSAPYLHDGSAATLREVLTVSNRDDKHGVISHLAGPEIEDLIAFLLALPYE